MSQVLVVAPHPDDETLGCGGTLLRHRAHGDDVHWLIVTEMRQDLGFPLEQIAKRKEEIARVSKHYDFASIVRLDLPTTRLDTIPLSELIERLAGAFERVAPDTVYIPFHGDVHSDHRIVSEACVACVKWFRNSFTRELLVYETPSETDFQLDPTQLTFRPNLYVDISPYLERKLEAVRLYPDETGDFPFPRSSEAVETLARKRGTEAGLQAAEAFMIARQVRR